jgi:hypothetical protein
VDRLPPIEIESEIARVRRERRPAQSEE